MKKYYLNYRVNQQIVEEAFLPTLNTLFNAPGSSPLTEINILSVSELLIQLTSPRHLLANQKATTKDQIEVNKIVDIDIMILILGFTSLFNF